jgi:hypothetical protein
VESAPRKMGRELFSKPTNGVALKAEKLKQIP